MESAAFECHRSHSNQGIAKAFETVEERAKEISRKSTSVAEESVVAAVQRKSTQVTGVRCYWCGKSGHNATTCRCHKCGKQGHIAVVCKSTTTSQFTTISRRTNQLEVQEGDVDEKEGDNELGLYNIDMVSTRAPPIYVEVRINGKSVLMIVDTGDAVSTVPEDVYKGLPTTTMENSEVVLTMHTGGRIMVLGKCRVVVCYANQEEELTVYMCMWSKVVILVYLEEIGFKRLD